MSLSFSDQKILYDLQKAFLDRPIDKSKILELYLENHKNEWRTKDAIQRYLVPKAEPLVQEKNLKITGNLEKVGTPVQHHRYDKQTLTNLCDKYGALKDYGLRWPWIKHIYKINGHNANQTIAVLDNDLKVIENIRNLHDKRNLFMNNKETTHDARLIATLDDKISILEGQINKLVRGRNFEITKLSVIPSYRLMFDLHWFILKHALEYVAEVMMVLRRQGHRGKHDAVRFITGKKSEILDAIIKNYENCEVLPGGGQVQLPLDRYQTYSESLFSEPVTRKKGNRSQKQGKKGKREERG